jgi:hypothetical protein
MCLEVIEDMLAAVNDRYIEDIADSLDRLRGMLPPEHLTEVERLYQLHLERSQAIAVRALVAGVAMGRGLAMYGSGSDPESGLPRL